MSAHAAVTLSVHGMVITADGPPRQHQRQRPPTSSMITLQCTAACLFVTTQCVVRRSGNDCSNAASSNDVIRRCYRYARTHRPNHSVLIMVCTYRTIDSTRRIASPSVTGVSYHIISYHLHLLRRHSANVQQRRTIQHIE